MVINISCCHPGYTFNNKTFLCEINTANGIIVRAHPRGRYFYAQVDQLYNGADKIIHECFFRVNFMSRTGMEIWCQL